jgi:hypothetical protein
MLVRADGAARHCGHVIDASSTAGEVERALAVGAPERVGWFRYLFGNEQWEWSAEVQRMHGYRPGTVTPTTELVLRHTHPDDYRQIPGTLELIRQTGQALTSRHRIRDVEGRIHHVIIVGDQVCDDTRTVIGIQGFYIDITHLELDRRYRLSAAVSRISENRAVIEQAKGMLMLVYGIDASTAFELLRWRSEQTNVALGQLAEQVARDFHGARSGDTTLPPPSTYDNLLLTAHLRTQRNGSQLLGG